MKKVAFLIVTAFLAIALIWMIPRLIPGDPVRTAAHDAIVNTDPEQAENIYNHYVKEFGLDKPAWQQYLLYLSNTGSHILVTTTGWISSTIGWVILICILIILLIATVTGKFNKTKSISIAIVVIVIWFVCAGISTIRGAGDGLGTSFMNYPTRVSTILSSALPWSLALMLPAVLVGFFIGNHLGSIIAYAKSKKNNALYGVIMFISQTPHYWLALVLLVVFAVKLSIFPVQGGYSPRMIPHLSFDFFVDALWHYILPFLAVVIISIGQWSLGMRAMMIHELDSDYVMYCEQLGVSVGKIRSYARRNAILPQFTGLPIQLGIAFSGSLVTEMVFNYPGVGSVLYSAIFAKDFPLIYGGCIAVALVVLILNFAADIAYGFIDPRIKTGYVEGG